jgi:hypothetical protein
MPGRKHAIMPSGASYSMLQLCTVSCQRNRSVTGRHISKCQEPRDPRSACQFIAERRKSTTSECVKQASNRVLTWMVQHPQSHSSFPSAASCNSAHHMCVHSYMQALRGSPLHETLGPTKNEPRATPQTRKANYKSNTSREQISPCRAYGQPCRQPLHRAQPEPYTSRAAGKHCGHCY